MNKSRQFITLQFYFVLSFILEVDLKLMPFSSGFLLFIKIMLFYFRVLVIYRHFFSCNCAIWTHTYLYFVSHICLKDTGFGPRKFVSGFLRQHRSAFFRFSSTIKVDSFVTTARNASLHFALFRFKTNGICAFTYKLPHFPPSTQVDNRNRSFQLFRLRPSVPFCSCDPVIPRILTITYNWRRHM